MYKSFFIVFLTSLQLSCFGWWDMGHMGVAKIAYEKLDDETKARVDALSALLGDTFPESADFVTSACWADDIRKEGVSAFSSWHGSSLPYDPENRLTKQQCEALIKSLKGKDAVFAVNQCLDTLRDPDASPWAQALMLRFLVHFVADLHQPLHCAALYNHTFPRGDMGGNAFKIQWEGQSKQNLHAFWDAACGLGAQNIKRPLDAAGRAELERFVDVVKNTYPDKCYTQVLKLDPKEWREEGYRLAVEYAYSGIRPGEKPSDEYIARGQEVCARQIALAGYRLGVLLSNTLNADSSLSRP